MRRSPFRFTRSIARVSNRRRLYLESLSPRILLNIDSGQNVIAEFASAEVHSAACNVLNSRLGTAVSKLVDEPITTLGQTLIGRPRPTRSQYIRSVSVYDSELEHLVSDVKEGQDISIAVELDGSFDTPQTLTVMADLNFNGIIEPAEIHRVTDIYDTRDFPQFYGYGFHIPDDGPWPGNGTPTDSLEIHVYFAGEKQTASVTLKNVAPKIIGHPSLTFGTDTNGDSMATLSVLIVDPGLQDRHTLTVTWGDGETSTSETFVDSDYCGSNQGRMATVIRSVAPGVQLLPLLVAVADDDLGQDRYQMLDLDIVVNDDDDNTNLQADLLEIGVVGEDDIVSLDLSPLITSEMNSDQGTFIFSYDLGVIHIWDSPEKNNLVLPFIDYAGGPGGIVTVPTLPYTGQRTVYVEGAYAGSTSITLAWISNENVNQWRGEWCQYPLLTSVGGSVDVTVWSIDLDIDSDNDNGFNLPQRNETEEFLEENVYGIGKMIFSDDEPFTPVVLQLPGGLDPHDPSISVRLGQQLSSATSSGTVHVWRKRHDDPTRTKTDRLRYGNHRLWQIGYDGTGEVVLYLEEASWSGNNKSKADVDRNGKTDDRLVVSLKVGALELSDTVKWMVVGPRTVRPLSMDETIAWPTFYPSLQYNRALRSAGAAEAVYNVASNQNFALKMLDEKEIRSLLNGKLSPEKISELVSNLGGLWNPGVGEPPIPDLEIRLYLDHVSLDYVLSFRGTDFPRLDDWVANIQNNLTGNSAQYSRAMYVAYWLGESGISFRNSGHSLGGGLATAASMTSGRFADTFNSAGLNHDTLFQNEYRVTDPDIPFYPVTPYALPFRDLLISAYTVWNIRPSIDFPDLDAFPGADVEDAADILTYLQSLGSQIAHADGTPLTFQAWGTNIQIEGLYNLNEDEAAALRSFSNAVDNVLNGRWTIALWHTFLANTFQGELIEKMTNSHGFPSIYFGLLHDLEGWNAYDNHVHSY